MPNSLSGEVTATPDQAHPFRVLIRRRGRIMLVLDADNKEEGDKTLRHTLDLLRSMLS